MRALRTAARTLAVVGLLSACVTARPARQPASLDDLLTVARGGDDGSPPLSGEAHVTLRAPGGDETAGRVYFAVDGAASLLLEGVTPSDETLGVAVLHGDRFMTWRTGDARCHVGPPCAADQQGLLPVPLSGPEMVGLLRGRPPLLEGTARIAPAGDGPAVRHVVWIEARGGARQRLEFAGPGRPLLRARIDGADGPVLDIRYGEHARGPHGATLPRDIVVARPSRGTEVAIRVLAVDAFEPREATFSTRCPEGLLEVPVACGADAVAPGAGLGRGPAESARDPGPGAR